MNNCLLARVYKIASAALWLNKCILVSSLFLLSLGINANPKLATKQQIGMFKNSKTCVVLENGLSVYNGYIKDAVNRYWKSTEYEFIDQTEFEKRRINSKYSFLVLMDAVYDKDPGGVSYTYPEPGSGRCCQQPD
jgi:exonuclease I